MANFPSIPMTWNFDNTTYIGDRWGTIAIHNDGTIIITGSVKEAALHLLRFALNEYEEDTCIEVALNETLCINYEHGICVSYLKDKKPEQWDDLVHEFERIKKMKAFW